MGKRHGVLLTKKVVESAPVSARRTHLWDSELTGFALRIEPTGVKTFVARYRADGGGRSATQRLMTIGRFGVVTVEQARKQAKTILGAAAIGSDPAHELRNKRRQMKVAALIDLYEAEGCVIQRGRRQGEAMKPRTKTYTMARLRHHVVPQLGHIRAAEINAGDIERFAADVTAGKTASDQVTGPRRRIVVRGGAGAARKVVRDLSAVFSFAKRREIVSINPCATAAVRKTDNREERFLTLDEVTQLGGALDALEREEENPKAINIARLWALTGCRRDEIAALKWPEVDEEEGLLRLGDSKTGKSLRPLGAAALVILQGIDRQGGSTFVFPADRGEGHFQGTRGVWAKAIERANLPGVTPHTLRHTMGSTAVSTGEALSLTGAILGHANPRSTAIYAHVQTDPSKRAANRVTKKIAAALAGKPANERGQRKERRDRRASKEDRELMRLLAEKFAENGPDASRLRAAVGQVVAHRKSG